jgi:hypothetical protein
MGGQIFISYRHDDGAPWARLVQSSLIRHFPQNQIFMDVDNLDPGIDFVEAIEESVGSCDVLIAVIGRRWLTVSDEPGKRRLDNARDFVRLEPQRTREKQGYLDDDRREREQKERAHAQPPERDERLELEHLQQVEQERLRDEQRLNPQSGRRHEPERLETQRLTGDERNRPETGRREAEERGTPPQQQKQEKEPQERGPWPLRVGPVVLSTVLGKIEDLKRWKASDLTGQARRRLVRLAVALALVLGTLLIIAAGITFMHKTENRFRQETRVAGAVAELTRFVHTGNLISAEVTFRNVSPIPVKFSCDGWQLIDEQNGDRLRPIAMGGEVNPSYPETLAPGATHVAWAKFKTEAGDLFDDKYSVIIESILNRPFEGLELKSQ